MYYVTGRHQWDFKYDDGYVLEAHQTASKFKVNGVLTHITNFPRSEIDFSSFLFLSSPKDVLEAGLSGDQRVGSVILDKELHTRIYVNTIFQFFLLLLLSVFR